MRTVVASLESISPYSQSKFHDTPALDKELKHDYEVRTWRERCHYGEDGYIFMPPMAFKNCMSEVAKYVSVKIPGKQNATFTKHFEAGLIVTDCLQLPIKKDEVKGEWLFVPADGKRGGGKRVKKCFPLIPAWAGKVIFHILDDTITEEVFEKHLKDAGSFIGIGRFRPRNNGFYGRFKVTNLSWNGEVANG